jgi:hypothetical protein
MKKFLFLIPLFWAGVAGADIFGYQVVGSSTAHGFMNSIYTSSGVLTVDATVQSISAYVHNNSAATAYAIKMSLYNATVSVSSATTIAIAEVEVVVPAGWDGVLTADVQDTLLSAGVYRFAWCTNNDNVKLYYVGITGANVYYVANTYANAFPSPFGSTSVTANRLYGVWATYETTTAVNYFIRKRKHLWW